MLATCGNRRQNVGFLPKSLVGRDDRQPLHFLGEWEHVIRLDLP